MRQWMVPPNLLCDKHLLGEHVEHHMMAGTISRGRNISGYLGGLFMPQELKNRHDVLADEMLNRGMKHDSPLAQPDWTPWGASVDVEMSLRDLAERCTECARRQKVMALASKPFSTCTGA